MKSKKLTQTDCLYGGYSLPAAVFIIVLIIRFIHT